MTLDDLAVIIAARQHDRPDVSYTARLLAGGIDRIGKKIGEESVELVMAAKDAELTAITHEAADLFYHVLVLLAATGITLTSIYAELDRRHESQAGNESTTPDRPTE